MEGDAPDGTGLNYQVWFQMHSLQDLNQRYAHNKEWMKGEKDFPIITQHKYDWCPNSVEYPLQEVIAQFGDYFTNSISYEIAWAILESAAYQEGGWETIQLRGIDMATSQDIQNAEFYHQRPSVELFIGIARGLGLEVDIPTQSDILKSCRLYGYEGSYKIQDKMRNRMDEIVKRRMAAEQQMDQARALYHGAVGALQDIEYWYRNWTWDTAEHQEWANPAIDKYLEQAKEEQSGEE